MGQALPQMRESEVLPHSGALDHEPGKVSLRIEDDPGSKAPEKAQRDPQHAWLPKPPLVVPEPKPQRGQESEPVDVVEPEPNSGGESQEGRERQRAPLIREHPEEEKHRQCRKQDRLRM